MNHYQAYRIGFNRGYKTHTLYEWVGNPEYEQAFRIGSYNGIQRWLNEEKQERGEKNVTRN